MDKSRLLMRVPKGSPLPPADDEVMLEELENWKWRVEMAAAGAAVLVSSSLCPHGLGLLPSALGWSGGGRWRPWPGTFEHSLGSLVSPSRQHTWTALSEKLACQGSTGIVQVGGEKIGVTLEQCQQACQDTSGCKAVDYFRATKWCTMWDAPCKGPNKNHDGASSWKLASKVSAAGLLEEGDFTFLDAKRRCQDLRACRGFSFSGTWSDKDQHGGVPHRVYFSSETAVKETAKSLKWASLVRKDNPRANCNPEGQQFECPGNPYACLGLSIDADDAAMKQAYRALSKRLHPDKVSGEARTKAGVAQAEAAFREMSDAYESLRDPQSRRQTDQRLRRQRQQWEEQRANFADLYIKESLVTSLEPESYPSLMQQGQEWLVHFFLPSNDECKQMKMAMGRAAAALGTGEEERDVTRQQAPRRGGVGMQPGDTFRGVVRERSSALRTEGAGVAEGDTHVAVVVQGGGKAMLYLMGEEVDVAISQDDGNRGPDGRPRWVLTTKERIYRGSFDRTAPDWLRGTIAEASDPSKDVSSFALQLDRWSETREATGAGGGGRKKPRLFGAVNCGRFPDFCKRKGVDPKLANRFPQVRMLFPGELRFELYRGRPLGREVAAFAREASRTLGEVPRLDKEQLMKLQGEPATFWVLLLQTEGSKVPWDCVLCRSALPALRRTAPRLVEAGVRVGWVNCTDETTKTACLHLSGEGDAGDAGEETRPDWGSFQLVELGRRPGAAAPEPLAVGEVTPPQTSVALWDSRLLVGEVGQAVLLSALEAGAGMAKLLGTRKEKGGASSGARGEL